MSHHLWKYLQQNFTPKQCLSDCITVQTSWTRHIVSKNPFKAFNGQLPLSLEQGLATELTLWIILQRLKKSWVSGDIKIVDPSVQIFLGIPFLWQYNLRILNNSLDPFKAVAWTDNIPLWRSTIAKYYIPFKKKWSILKLLNA